MNHVIETLETEHDEIYKRNEHIKKQIEMFREIINQHKKEYEQNKIKMKQINYILDNHVYNFKEEP